MSPTALFKLFEKMLTEVDIPHRLVLEANPFFPHRPEFNHANTYVEFCAMDEDQQRVWAFRFFTGYRVGDVELKPVILEGWAEFVRHYGLRVKDKVIFYERNQRDSDAVPFVIHIRRTIRLFGVDITEAD